jgi:hypothetical protein
VITSQWLHSVHCSEMAESTKLDGFLIRVRENMQDKIDTDASMDHQIDQQRFSTGLQLIVDCSLNGNDRSHTLLAIVQAYTFRYPFLTMHFRPKFPNLNDMHLQLPPVPFHDSEQTRRFVEEGAVRIARVGVRSGRVVITSQVDCFA